jgi:hypothetical protein
LFPEKSALFEMRKPTESRTSNYKGDDDLEISDFGLKAGPHLQVNDSHQIFDQDLEGYAPS